MEKSPTSSLTREVSSHIYGLLRFIHILHIPYYYYDSNTLLN